MDFLVSLSPKAKEKLANIKAQNKSVMYQEQTLSEEDVSDTLFWRKIRLG
jgi:THO complex subunit 1